MIAGIIQARMGSTRLAGKMNMEMQGVALLTWVLRRVKRATRLDDVVLALPDTAENDVLHAIGDEEGVRVVRGDEQDVLGRFLKAASVVGAQTIVRICADNPLIAPEEIDRLVLFFQKHPCDYAYNHIPTDDYPGPDGLGAEIVTRAALDASAASTDSDDHEHVTRYVKRHPETFRLLAAPAPAALQGIRHMKFDVDTQADFDDLTAFTSGLTPQATLEDIIAQVHANA